MNGFVPYIIIGAWIAPCLYFPFRVLREALG